MSVVADSTLAKFKRVTKRDGRVVNFDPDRIASAVYRAMEASGEGDLDNDPELIASAVANTLLERNKFAPSIEEIQDVVEEQLILFEFAKVAKAYILYRNERQLAREKERQVPQEARDLVDQSKRYFQNPYSEFIFWRTYSRWIDEKGRRETWVETVDRYMHFMRENVTVTDEEYEEIRSAILNMEVMPSMRLAWSAGEAARKEPATAYNCAYMVIDTLDAFGELLYLLMCGCGVGYSIESKNIEKLPIVKAQDPDYVPQTYVVEDSREGWAEALVHCLKTWFEGKDVIPDTSKLRGAGARLKTMGGRSSGPAPLIELLQFSRSVILSRQGRRLSSLNVLDIGNKIGVIVEMGGVRRSSEITLSDLDDVSIRDAKAGHFYVTHPHRQMSNNSVAYDEKPSVLEFMDEWLNLAKSGTGERGIFNRGSLPQQIPSRRLKTLDSVIDLVGTNPCGEVILKPKSFCNLTEVVARPNDDLKSIKRKIKIGTILGTYQSKLTNFKGLSPEWKENCDQERLLGVSVTGQWDSNVFRSVDTQRWAKAIAIDTNIEYAKRWSINESVAITVVKPSGTVSQLVNASSGMHPRYAPYFIRRVRISATDPLFHMLRDEKVPFSPEVGQTMDTATTFVIEFPIKAPDGSIFRNDLTAIQQLEYWKQVKENYTEHNPSQTVYVGEGEWLDVGHWVYKHWDIIGGLSFLPREDHSYALAPYEEITKEEYEKRVSEFPEIDFAKLTLYEQDDNTTGSRALACVGDSCEVL